MPLEGMSPEAVTALLRELFSASSGAVAFSEHGELRAVNPAMVRLFGYDDEAELLGRSVLDLVAPDARDLIAELLRRRGMREEVPPLFVTRGLRRDGSHFPLELRATELLLRGQVYSLAMLRELPAEPAQVSVDRESDAFYRALFDVNTAVKLLIAPTTGQIVDANQAAVDFYGWPLEVLRTLRITDINTLTPEEVKAEMRNAQSGKRRYFRFRHRTQSGEIRHVEVHSGPVTLGGQQLLLSIIHDVTERDLLEEQLREAQRLEAIGRLAGGIAHDFNNLLTVMMNAAELVGREVPAHSATRPYVEDLLHAAQRGAELTRQLLAFSRRQVMQRRPMQLNDVVRRMVGLLQRTLGSEIVVSSILEPDLPHVLADPSQMEQVLMNLAINARDAMPDGGELSLRTAVVTVGADGSSMLPAGGWVSLTVRDQGAGMDEETRARVFEPFFTTKRGQGTGMGLATVYGVIAQTGGHVTVASAPGQGSEFRIYLPIAEHRAAAEEPKRVEPRPTRDAGERRVLLCEDLEAVRVTLARGLRAAGFRVEGVSSADEALAQLDRDGAPDVLVTDVVMPGPSGIELARAVAERHPAIRILLVSGDVRDHSLSSLPESVRWLQKPFTVDRLVAEIGELLGAG